MLLTGILVATVIISVVWLLTRTNKSLDHLPGPSLTLWNQIKTTRTLEPTKHHLYMAELRKKYGPIFKFSAAMVTKVVVSDYDTIYQLLVKSGREFGGRLTSFKLHHVMQDTGILFSYNNDVTWKTLRKVSQKHLRQFGEGMSKIESVINEVAEDMFGDFADNLGKPFDPGQSIFDTALNSIAFLITGKRSHVGDKIVEDMRVYEDLFKRTTNNFAPGYFLLLEVFPWLRHLKFDQWPPYQTLKRLHHTIWKDVNDINEHKPGLDNICEVLRRETSKGDGIITEKDAQSTALSLLFAGVTTTSATFYPAVNMLAHHPEIQKRLHTEVQQVSSENGGRVTLADRPKMPYTRAVLFEVLRYTSVVSHGVQHRTTQETQLAGYKIPPSTQIEYSIWNLHHDENFWDAPYEFKPERFLDENGELLPADHPNRTHLIPFGAGIRVCLGESLAMARLFLWLTILADRFQVVPAPGNEKSSCDARYFNFEGVLMATKYEVVFRKWQ